MSLYNKIAVLVSALGIFAALSLGQENYSYRQLVKDQQKLQQKVQELEKKMERVLLRIEAEEGREDEAKRLKTALEMIRGSRDDKGNLCYGDVSIPQGNQSAVIKVPVYVDRQGNNQEAIKSRMDRLVELIQGGNLRSATGMLVSVREGMQSMLDVLLNRRSLTEYEKKIQQLEETKQEVNALANQEKDLQQQTEKIEEEQKAKLSQKLKELQQNLDKAIQSQHQVMEETRDVSGRQDRVLDRMEQEIKEMIAEQQEHLDRVASDKFAPELLRYKNAIEELTKEQEKLADEIGRQEQAEWAVDEMEKLLEDEAAASPEDGRKQEEFLQKLAERFQELAKAQGETAQMTEKVQPLSDWSQAIRKLQQRQAQASEALKRVQEGDRYDEGDLNRLERGQSRVARDTREMAGELRRALDDKELLKELGYTEDDAKPYQNAVNNLENLANQMEDSARLIAQGKLKEAADIHDKTVKQFEEAAGEAENAQNGQNAARNYLKKIAQDQEGHGESAKKLEEALAEFPNKFAKQPENLKKAGQYLGMARQDMEDAGKNLKEEKAGQAVYTQKRALEYLGAAQEAIQGTAAGKDPASPEEKFAKRQQQIADRINELSRLPSLKQKPESRLLEDAARLLSESAQQAEPGKTEQAREELRQAARQLKEALGNPENISRLTAGQNEIADKTRKISGELAQMPPGEEPARHLQDAGENMKRASGEIGDRQFPEAKDSSAKAIEDLKQSLAAMEEMARRQGDLGEIEERQRIMGQRAADMGRQLKEVAEDYPADTKSHLNDAGGEVDKAAGAMNQASQSLGKKDTGATAEEQKQALEHLKNAASEFPKIKDSAMKKHADKLAALEERQANVSKEVQDLLNEMKKAGVDPKIDESNKSKLKQGEEKVEEAARHIEDARKRLSKKLPKDAVGDQQQALDQMQQARRDLEGMKQETLTAEQKKRLEKQAKDQEKIRQLAQQLEEKLERLKREKTAQSLSRAGDEMENAQREMNRGDTTQAKEREEDAIKHMSEAERDLEKEKWKYEKLRQDEILFDMEGKLKAVCEAQKKILEQTREFYKNVEANPGKLTRYQLQQINLRLVKPQRELVQQMKEIMDVLVRERSQVFSWVCERIQKDMESAAERMKSGDLGELTQECEVQAIEQLERLIRAFQEEQKQREEEQKQPPGAEEMPEMRPQILPAYTELKMLRQIQLDIKDKTDSLYRRIQSGKAPDPYIKQRLEKLGQEEGSLSDITKKFIENLEQNR